MPFVLAFARSKFLRIRAFLQRVFNRGKSYLAFPLRKQHDRLMHKGGPLRPLSMKNCLDQI